MPVYKYGPKNKWFFSISIKGKVYKRRGFDTAREAKEAEKLFYFEHTEISQVANELFARFALEYINEIKQNIKKTTAYDYKKVIEGKLMPVFGNLKVNKITPIMISKWRNELLNQHSRTYVLKIFRYLNAIFRYMFYFYGYKDNPCSSIARIKRLEAKKERPFYTKDQFDAFYSKLPDDLLYLTMFRTFFFLGLRIGELQALQWKDVDLDKKEISINKTYSRFKNGENRLGKTKTASSNASLTIPEMLLEMYKQLKKQQEKRYIEIHEEDFVFGTDAPISDKTIHRVAQSAMKAAGLPQLTIHGLRHSCGSYYLSIGIPIDIVSKILRHSDIGTTTRIYLHVSEDRVSSTLSSIKI